MKHSGDPIDAAKSVVLRSFSDEDWFSGVGIGRLAAGIGLVISVTPGSRSRAKQSIESLQLDVPIELRELGNIRKR